MPFGGKIINSCKLAHQTGKNFYLGYRFQNKNETLCLLNFASYMVIHTRKMRIMRSRGENVIYKVENEKNDEFWHCFFSRFSICIVFAFSFFLLIFSIFSGRNISRFNLLQNQENLHID